MNMNMGGFPEEKKSTGPMVGIIIVVIVLLAGAAFAFRSSKESIKEEVSPSTNGGQVVTEEKVSVDSTVSELSIQGSSSDISEIEADMKATNLSGLDTGFAEISDSL